MTLLIRLRKPSRHEQIPRKLQSFNSAEVALDLQIREQRPSSMSNTEDEKDCLIQNYITQVAC